MNSDLLKAILAMDSYNRGYGAGIDLGENSDAINVEIANATIYDNSTRALGTGVDSAVGFYAIAYTVGTGPGAETIISYRGTNGGLIFS